QKRGHESVHSSRRIFSDLYEAETAGLPDWRHSGRAGCPGQGRSCETMNARRVLRFVIAGAALALLLPSILLCQTAQRYSASGLVLEIKTPKRFLVSCAEIPGFMDAMVMT